MVYLASAVALIFLSNAIAVFVIETVDVSSYVDIMVICRLLVETTEQCSQPAVYAGWVGCWSAIILLILLFAVNRKHAPQCFNKVGGAAFVTIAPLCIAVVACHFVLELRSPWPIYREEIFKYYAAALSLGNLLWPLCLQLAINSMDLKWRISFLCVLAPILAFLPFRGVLFAVAIFGIIIPSFEYAFRQVRRYGVRSKQVAMCGFFLTVCLSAIILQLSIETRERPTDLKIAGGFGKQIAERLGQRIAIPLFQAHFAERHELDPGIPTLADELLTKLRLRTATSANGFLYAKSHGGVSFGETTSLYFGEAVLRTTSIPIIWSVVAPWLLILLWTALRGVGYETGALVGIAIWRGSLGGAVSILPSLSIQIALLILICKYLGKPQIEGEHRG
jgi:hypothetical protein